MDVNEITQIIDHVIKSKIHMVVISFILGTTALLLLKIIAEAITGYIQFRLDQHVAIGSPVQIYGLKGRIREASIFTITVETHIGFIRIPTKVWRLSKYIVLKDKVLVELIKEEEVCEEIKQ